MEKAAAMVEAIFTRALALPAGAVRNDFIAKKCAGDPALRQEVESLVEAYQDSEKFLAPRPTATPLISSSTHDSSTPGAAQPSPPERAAAFLHRDRPGAGEELARYIQSLPAAVQQETRERIEAGSRAKTIQVTSGLNAELDLSRLRLPGYRLEHKLGEGGLGIVYAAHDEKLNRRVALKILRPHPDQALQQRLLAEARKAAALADPGIVTIFSVLDETDPPAIVMELVEGFPLDRFAAQLNFGQKARLLREVAQALAVAHRKGVIHRDLKPENILVGPDMRPRILDFGLALYLQEAGAQRGGFEGTPLYASPEQVQAKPLSAASDLFSFGSVMFTVLTGRPPFAGETVNQVLEAIATTSPPFIREVAVGVPEDLQAICLACLAWDPADRPTASEVALELGRFLVGEPVRLRPKLYDDLLRRTITEYSTQAKGWQSQNIISAEERDALEIVHRRLLVDEDHWIIDARRITLLQTLLSGGTWLAVVASVLAVWLLRDELAAPWRWLFPTGLTLAFLGAGYGAHRSKEALAAATFFAGAALAVAPCTLALLSELGAFTKPSPGITQLFGATFTNQQVSVASLIALSISGFGWWRLRMTGFAWTTAALAVASYLSFLLLHNWLEQKPEIQALWCLPLIAMETFALVFERLGRVRWTLPFHLISLLTLVGSLDVMASNGPTLQMLGISTTRWPYFDHDRLEAFSFALNGSLFLFLMALFERASSLDLRRASKLLEILAILHILSALFANALSHRAAPYVRADVWLYISAALLLLALAPMRSRWRLLSGGLAGCGLGSYLLVDLGLVARRPFILSLGLVGLLVALGTLLYVRKLQRARAKSEWPRP